MSVHEDGKPLVVEKNGTVFSVVEGKAWFERDFCSHWEEDTLQVIDRFADRGKTYLDIGSWIGPTVLYAAGKYRRVCAWEPYDVVRNMLRRNLEHNGVTNVTVSPLAIADVDGTRTLGRTGEKRITQSASSLLIGDNYSRRLQVATGKVLTAHTSEAVGCRTFRSALAEAEVEVSDVALIKIDVEGGELLLVEGMVDVLRGIPRVPPLYISLHWNLLTPEEITKVLNRLMTVYSRVYEADRQVSVGEVVQHRHEALLCTQ